MCISPRRVTSHLSSVALDFTTDSNLCILMYQSVVWNQVYPFVGTHSGSSALGKDSSRASCAYLLKNAAAPHIMESREASLSSQWSFLSIPMPFSHVHSGVCLCQWRTAVCGCCLLIFISKSAKSTRSPCIMVRTWSLCFPFSKDSAMRAILSWPDSLQACARLKSSVARRSRNAQPVLLWAAILRMPPAAATRHSMAGACSQRLQGAT
mmetsp:Transcript_21967/g.50203  ORF Transcript_21967/g.50203 Transcript_21967/m.50203 type:complete len:209 (+) Transcript_21967:699-1325(+)